MARNTINATICLFIFPSSFLKKNLGVMEYWNNGYCAPSSQAERGGQVAGRQHLSL
jgi:hypothetical protein